MARSVYTYYYIRVYHCMQLSDNDNNGGSENSADEELSRGSESSFNTRLSSCRVSLVSKSAAVRKTGYDTYLCKCQGQGFSSFDRIAYVNHTLLMKN